MKSITSILPIIVVLAVIAAVMLARATNRGSSKRPTYSVRARRFLTDREIEFMRRLDQALGDAAVHICPQVSFDSILQAIGDDASGRESLRARYKQKRVDFALMDAKAAVILIVEVDDSTHDGRMAQEKDAFRDDLMASAGIPTLRIPKGPLPTVAFLTAQLRTLHPELRIR